MTYSTSMRPTLHSDRGGRRVLQLSRPTGKTDIVEDIMSSLTMAHRIRAIGEKLDDATKDKDKFNLQVIIGTSRLENNRPRRNTSSILPDESPVIGRDDEKRRIMNLLLASSDKTESKISVLPIVGMGGLGKTALAQCVFSDDKIKKHFHELMMWVCVSNEFDLQRITKEIIDAAASFKKVRQKNNDNTNWDATQNRVQEMVKHTRFLLVLDDMWEDDRSKWEKLVGPLRVGEKGSKILVTTRSKKVASIVKEGMNPIILGGLSDDHLLSLFKRCAFYNYHPSEQIQFEAFSNQIVERLKGSPLAAKTLGHLLNEHLDVKYWRRIMKTNLWELQQGEDDIFPVLRISYQHLPPLLKQCFTFCSLFQKDYMFQKGQLVKLWMAQCLIQSENDMSMEDVGREYFNDLLFRSFFESGQYTSEFMMHDLIHDLAESTSNGECFRMGDVASKEVPKMVCHISVVTKKVDVARLKELDKHESLRTLLFVRGCNSDLSHVLPDLFSKLRRVRILGLSDCKIKVLPDSIGDLKHLRYLDLTDNPIDKLPESLSRLHNLQVLKLKKCPRLRELPNSIGDLINLRHLVGDKKLISKFNGIGKLTCLQKLKMSADKIKELRDMNMLRKLCIRNLEVITNKDVVLDAKLSSKEHLEVLRLTWAEDRDVDDSLNREVDEEEVLDGLKPHADLKQLAVECYRGVRSPTWMEDGSLYCLQTIVLENWMNWERFSAVNPHQSFLPCLRELVICKCPKLREMPPLPPALTELSIWRCYELALLKGSGHLPSLRSLYIDGCPNLTWSSSSSSTTSSSLSSEINVLPSSLENVTVVSCGDTMDRCLSASLQNFTSLSSLSITDCPHTSSSLLLGLGQPHVLQQLTELTISYSESLRVASPTPLQQPLPLPPPPPPPAHHREGGGFRSFASLRELRIPTMLLEPLSRHSGGGLPSSLVGLSIEGGRGRGDPDLNVVADRDSDHLHDHALSTCLHGLTSLRYLSISGDDALTSLPAGEDVLCHLTALEELFVTDCRELTSLGGLQALPSLRSLNIDNCPKLRLLVSRPSPPSPLRWFDITGSSPQQMKGWLLQITVSSFPSFQSLNISRCPELRSFGGGCGDHDEDDDGRELDEALLNLAPSPTSLVINSCKNLRSLPASLSRFTSLETLSIWCCPQIQSLPELPPSLRSLEIIDCPALMESCREEGGPDWPKISHIPDVRCR